MKLVIYPEIFIKSSNFKFHENPSSGSRVVPCAQTDLTKTTVAFRSFRTLLTRRAGSDIMLRFYWLPGCGFYLSAVREMYVPCNRTDRQKVNKLTTYAYSDKV